MNTSSSTRRSSIVGTLLPVGSRRRRLVAVMVRRAAPSSRPQQQTPEQLAARRKAAAKRRRAEAKRLQLEETKLKQSWANAKPENLDVYLVSGYQDPRINVQSILARHMLVRALFGSDFDDLMHDELVHAVDLNEEMRVHADQAGIDMAWGNPDAVANWARAFEVIADRASAFAERWRAALAERQAPPLSVLEFACGSANDYRAFADYGIARFLDYTGIDLNDANIANAKRRYPDITFRVDSILSLPEADRSYDYVIGFDILEHLSLPAKKTAMNEAVRISRRGIYFALFRMEEIPDDIANPIRKYHSNTLSAPKMRAYMTKRFTSVQLIDIPKLLKDEFGADQTYNTKTYSLIAEGPHQPR